MNKIICCPSFLPQIKTIKQKTQSFLLTQEMKRVSLLLCYYSLFTKVQSTSLFFSRVIHNSCNKTLVKLDTGLCWQWLNWGRGRLQSAGSSKGAPLLPLTNPVSAIRLINPIGRSNLLSTTKTHTHTHTQRDCSHMQQAGGGTDLPQM